MFEALKKRASNLPNRWTKINHKRTEGNVRRLTYINQIKVGEKSGKWWRLMAILSQKRQCKVVFICKEKLERDKNLERKEKIIYKCCNLIGQHQENFFFLVGFLSLQFSPAFITNEILLWYYWVLPSARHLENWRSLQMTVTSIGEGTVTSNDWPSACDFYWHHFYL